ncbi:hypothetical protein Tco_0009309 [Tanacetum coccineum]
MFKGVVKVVSSDRRNNFSLGDQEDASKQGRKINNIDADAEITLVDESQGKGKGKKALHKEGCGIRKDKKGGGEGPGNGQDMAEKEVSTADPVTTASEVVTTANVEAKIEADQLLAKRLQAGEQV